MKNLQLGLTCHGTWKLGCLIEIFAYGLHFCYTRLSLIVHVEQCLIQRFCLILLVVQKNLTNIQHVCIALYVLHYDLSFNFDIMHLHVYIICGRYNFGIKYSSNLSGVVSFKLHVVFDVFFFYLQKCKVLELLGTVVALVD